jgi:magnesium chelatase subunit I
VLRARGAVGSVTVPDALLTSAAQLCRGLGTDGLRGELTLMRAMRALAAYEGATCATSHHLRAVAGVCLGHRLRRDPLDDVRSLVRVERAVGELLGA